MMPNADSKRHPKNSSQCFGNRQEGDVPTYKTSCRDPKRHHPAFTDSSLTDVEKKNVATITAYEKKAVSAMSVIEG